MTRVLELALDEEATRRIDIINKIEALADFFRTSFQNHPITKEQALSNLDDHSKIIDIINKYLFNSWLIKHASFPLKTNKLSALFSCAKNVVDEKFEDLTTKHLSTIYKMDSSNRTVLGGEKGDIKGTSLLNCINTALISLITQILEVKSIREIEPLQENNILNVDVSSIVQTAAFPDGFNIENIEQNLIDNLYNWPFFYKDSLSPKEGELLIPTVGYALGGSRSTLRYTDKIMRNEDCSSAIAKWVGSPYSFSTVQMLELYNGESCDNHFCYTISQIIVPLKVDLANIIPGDIFVRSNHLTNARHTGVVTNLTVIDTNNEHLQKCFEVLSYHRDMPFIEGIGFSIECLNETNHQIVFFRADDNFGICNPDYFF
jgi:hypothetical protein